MDQNGDQPLVEICKFEKSNSGASLQGNAIKTVLDSKESTNSNDASILENDDHDSTLLAEDNELTRSEVKVTKPNFEKVYKEFEKIQRRKTKAISEAYNAQHTAMLQAIQMSVANRKRLPEEGSLVGAMNSFMATHSAASGLCASPFNVCNWRPEAQGLIQEFNRLKESSNRASSIWASKKRSESMGSDLIDDFQSSIPDNNNDNSSSLFSNLDGSNSTSDDETGCAIIDANLSLAVKEKNLLAPIGHLPRQIGKHSNRSLSLDSGYQSAGHNGSKKTRGSQSSITDNFDDVYQEPSVSSNDRSEVFEYEPISPIKGELSYREPVYGSYNNWMHVTYSPHPSHVCVESFPVTDMSANSSASLKTSLDEGCGGHQRHKKWITEEILEMIAVRDKLYKRMKKYPSPDIICMYKKIRNMVVGMTRNAKRAYEKKEDYNSNPSNRGRRGYKKTLERKPNCPR